MKKVLSALKKAIFYLLLVLMTFLFTGLWENYVSPHLGFYISGISICGLLIVAFFFIIISSVHKAETLDPKDEEQQKNKRINSKFHLAGELLLITIVIISIAVDLYMCRGLRQKRDADIAEAQSIYPECTRIEGRVYNLRVELICHNLSRRFVHSYSGLCDISEYYMETGRSIESYNKIAVFPTWACKPRKAKDQEAVSLQP